MFKYIADGRNRFAVALPQFFPHLWDLRYIFLIVLFFLIFFAINWNFGFFFYREYAMLPIVIIMKKRGWILYPYSIFHAKIACGFVHHVLSIIPGTDICHLIFWYGQNSILEVLAFSLAGLWIKLLLAIVNWRSLVIGWMYSVFVSNSIWVPPYSRTEKSFWGFASGPWEAS